MINCIVSNWIRHDHTNAIVKKFLSQSDKSRNNFIFNMSNGNEHETILNDHEKKQAIALYCIDAGTKENNKRNWTMMMINCMVLHSFVVCWHDYGLNEVTNGCCWCGSYYLQGSADRRTNKGFKKRKSIVLETSFRCVSFPSAGEGNALKGLIDQTLMKVCWYRIRWCGSTS